MAYDKNTVLGIVKARLNRLDEDTTLDAYLLQRIEAADEELVAMGIHLIPDSANDAAFLADTVVWQYGNRDNMHGVPDWLRLARRERWLRKREVLNDS